MVKQQEKASAAATIVAKVAQVLNERELVINIGVSEGVHIGQRFAVLAAASLEIKDPDSGEILGSIDREKIRVEAVQVLDRFTVCRTYQSHWVGELDYMSLAAFRQREEVVETLRADKSALPKDLSLEESVVKIGDPVKRVGQQGDN